VLGFIFVFYRACLGNTSVLMFNTYNLRSSESVKGEICKIEKSRGLSKYVICDQRKGFYFSYESDESLLTEDIVNSFIQEGKTIVTKLKGSTDVLFVNGSDTLIVNYEKDGEYLVNGIVKR